MRISLLGYESTAIACRPAGSACLATVDGSAQGHCQIMAPIGLAQQFDSRVKSSVSGNGVGRIARGADDFDLRASDRHFPGKVTTANAAGKNYIGQHNVDVGDPVDGFEGACAILGLANTVTQSRYSLYRKVAHPMIVFNDQDHLAIAADPGFAGFCVVRRDGGGGIAKFVKPEPYFMPRSRRMLA